MFTALGSTGGACFSRKVHIQLSHDRKTGGLVLCLKMLDLAQHAELKLSHHQTKMASSQRFGDSCNFTHTLQSQMFDYSYS